MIIIVIQYAHRVRWAYCKNNPVSVVIILHFKLILPISNWFECCSQKFNNKYYEFINNILFVLFKFILSALVLLGSDVQHFSRKWRTHFFDNFIYIKIDKLD